jgi:transposase
MAICDRGGLPIAVHVASASPYEPHLVPATLDARFLPDLPWCLIGDRGYDSDGLDDLLMTQYGIEMIAANRRGRAKTQDGRPLRRAKRRWKIERLFAWLHNCRRVVTHWERHVGNYLGMVQLACARILLRASIRQPAASRWINNRRLLGSLHSSNGTSGAPE